MKSILAPEKPFRCRRVKRKGNFDSVTELQMRLWCLPISLTMLQPIRRTSPTDLISASSGGDVRLHW